MTTPIDVVPTLVGVNRGVRTAAIVGTYVVPTLVGVNRWATEPRLPRQSLSPRWWG